MPLLHRADSTLVVVDAQRVFDGQRSMTAAEREAGAATPERLRWLAGLAALLEIPAVVVEAGTPVAAIRDGRCAPPRSGSDRRR